MTKKFKPVYGETTVICLLLLIPNMLICYATMYLLLNMFNNKYIEMLVMFYVFLILILILIFINLIIYLLALALMKNNVEINEKELKYKNNCIELSSIKKIKFNIGSIGRSGYPSKISIYSKYSKVLHINRASIRLYLYLKNRCKWSKTEVVEYKLITKGYPIFSFILAIIFAIILIFS